MALLRSSDDFCGAFVSHPLDPWRERRDDDLLDWLPVTRCRLVSALRHQGDAGNGDSTVALNFPA